MSDTAACPIVANATNDGINCVVDEWSEWSECSGDGNQMVVICTYDPMRSTPTSVFGHSESSRYPSWFGCRGNPFTLNLTDDSVVKLLPGDSQILRGLSILS